MKVAKTSRGGWLRWLVIAGCIPIVVLLIGVVLVSAREFKAGSRLQAKRTELKQAGLPFDNASFGQWYRDHTHPEGRSAWVEVLESVSATTLLGEIDIVPIIGQGKEIAELDPKAEWREESLAKEYLTEMQGLIAKAHKLKQWPTPVQLPIEFQGAGTLLPYFQQSRSLARLLQLDYEYAFYHGEFERAMQDLQSIGNVAKAIDNDLCLVVDLIAVATLQVQYHEIQRSLVTDSWPAEKLNELRQMVSQARFTPAKWRNLITCERAMFGDDVALGDLSRITDAKEAALVPLLNTGRLRIFEVYDDLMRSANGELAALRSASKNATTRILKRNATLDVDGAQIWIAQLFPATEQMALALENEESNRRLTLAAIALRQYKSQEGKWPSHLSELTKVSLPPTNCSTVNRGAFGYEVEDDVAYLWGSNAGNDEPVQSARPANDPDASMGGYVTSVKLR